VNQNVTHTNDIIPRYFTVLLLEFKRKHIGGLADYFHVLNDSKIPELIAH
jgi:hypothetical protein